MQAQPPTESSESSSSVELVAIPPDDVDVIEGMYRRLIAPALLRTRKTSAKGLFKEAREGRSQLWLVWEPERKVELGACVTEVIDYPDRRVARIVLGAGRLVNHWHALLGKLESWAREEGCVSIEVVGRRGWGRVLPEGYELIESSFSKELK
jgi:hypothetical protein